MPRLAAGHRGGGQTHGTEPDLEPRHMELSLPSPILISQVPDDCQMYELNKCFLLYVTELLWVFVLEQ